MVSSTCTHFIDYVCVAGAKGREASATNIHRQQRDSMESRSSQLTGRETVRKMSVPSLSYL
jgi:hypothetical protein